MPETPAHPSFREAFAFWLKLGFISFGGPAGQISIMHAYLVEKKKWISDSRFLHALNYCMLLPGPEAQQLATYCGWLLHGKRGGVIAGLLFILPSVFMLWGLSLIYVTYGDTPLVASMFAFLKPAVVAVILVALIKIGKKSLTTPIHYIIAAIAFILIYFLKTPFPFIILGAMVIGLILSRLKNNTLTTEFKHEQPSDETSFVINQNTIAKGKAFQWKSFLLNLFIFALLWIVPLAILYISGNSAFSFWEKLSVFFTKAAFVTFGGAYAVLPYVAQVSVETFGWLSEFEMIDGLALGETTPGPLIMVLSFVGFMAGYHTFDGSLSMATLGLTLTTYYTFLPSFFFILAGAPFIERTQTNTYLKSVLGYITSAVAGVILNLGLIFGQSVLMPAPMEFLWVPLIWFILSMIALQYFKINMITWIGISLGIGIIKFILQAQP